jgi:triacylglycerol lipase
MFSGALMIDSQAAPIVLAHGVFGFNQLHVAGLKLVDYFRRIGDALRSDGHLVPVPPQLNLTGSVAERAVDLKAYLEDENNGEVFGRKVHIIAHSMGGLDARFMISRLGMADRVLSLTTIGTPHHGSPIADIVDTGTHPVLNELLEQLGIDLQAIPDLTTAAARRFNSDVPDNSSVCYFSIAGQYEPKRLFGNPLGLLGIPHDIVREREKANDGLVSVASATFVQAASNWTLLDVWNANHYQLVNWGLNLLPTPAELNNHATIDKYRALANRIKQEVSARTN